MATFYVEDVLSDSLDYLTVVSQIDTSLRQDQRITSGSKLLLLADTRNSSVTNVNSALTTSTKDILEIKSGVSPTSNSVSRPITITESEVLDSDIEDETDDFSITPVSSREPSCTGIVQDLFQRAKSQWIPDPVIKRWQSPDHRVHSVLAEVDSLYHEWKEIRVGPFSPVTDNVWLEVGRVLADVGLPWHNNQINMPDEIDTSWPFHFKSFETQVIRIKGSRVGNPNPSGYICNWGEANCYGIRALQQELRGKCPTRRPILVYDRIEDEIVRSAEKLFGLELHRIDLMQDVSSFLQELQAITLYGSRPIIFAATLANSSGHYDNIESICKISETFPLILHVDASRNFDYITTMLDEERQRLQIPKLTLGLRDLECPLLQADGSILASTIIAGGANYTSPTPVVALKPLALGSTSVKVAYTRASDSTLAGSRDAIAPLWVALQELRFGESGFRQTYQRCARMKESLAQLLRSHGVEVSTPPCSLDMLFETPSQFQVQHLVRLGGILTINGDVLLTVQPSVTAEDLGSIVSVFMHSEQLMAEINVALAETEESFNHTFSVPQNIVTELETTVNAWKVATRSAAGYPFHMGSYSALGPVIGAFFDIKIPNTWTEVKAHEVIELRLKSFGLIDAIDRSKFKGAFTNGSTMGNRVGIHTALSHFPGAYLYFSKETHYSVPKTARDCDTLASRWSERNCRYSEIPCNADGSICIQSLVEQAVADRTECQKFGDSYRIVLFLNMGTTFVGARDNLKEIRRCLAAVNLEIAYVHMDGALDFGFHDCGVALAPPGITEVNGVPAVQGVTLSHHKAMGNMVSGEVLCYSPGEQMATLASGVDPRAVFETWLYLQMYSEADLIEMFEYCKSNASRLETGLDAIGVVTKRNQDSTIVVLERPPAWVTEEFSLRPQEDWVHFITMPHVSTESVDLFVHRIAWVDQQCRTAFSYVSASLASAMSKPLRLQRIQCRSVLAERVAAMAQALVQPTDQYSESVDLAIKASLRGAMSVVAMDEHDEPQAVFLAESTRTRTIKAGPVLVNARHVHSKTMVVDVARQLIGFMGRHLYAPVELDELSYTFLPVLP